MRVAKCGRLGHRSQSKYAAHSDCIRTTQTFVRLGSPIMTAFNMEFQTHFFSILPPTFPSAFKALCASTLGEEEDPEMWKTFETLGPARAL